MKERSVDFATFKHIQDEMIAKSSTSNRWGRYESKRIKSYTTEEIESIVKEGTLLSQQKLSHDYFMTDGIYRRIILHYATLLTYAGLVIPNAAPGRQLSSPHILKRYRSAVDYMDKQPLAELLTHISKEVLEKGAYYGIISTLDKEKFVLFDLPTNYCMSRYKDGYGNDIVEFNVQYFDSILNKSIRNVILKSYPSVITTYYKRYHKNLVDSPWVTLPTEIGVYFSFYDDGRPFFLDVIPASCRYDDAIETEREKELEEIRKIIVQKIPHLSDGQLLFEPDEALEMHRGTVGMMKGNKNISVLTTYGDVDAIISKTSNENSASSLEKMLQTVYSDAGVSAQVFAPSGSQALSTSLANDTSLMMILANKYNRFLTYILNILFANANINFKYKIFPITLYNKSEFITDTLKLAQNGYSFLLPALAAGINQSDLMNLKELENDVLELNKILKPLSSSYTQSASDEPGAPTKKLEDKAEKTIQNEASLDHQGGSNE